MKFMLLVVFGIWVALSLNSYPYISQAEVCFVGGIASQYIRSCLIFTATREAGARLDYISCYIIFIIISYNQSLTITYYIVQVSEITERNKIGDKQKF